MIFPVNIYVSENAGQSFTSFYEAIIGKILTNYGPCIKMQESFPENIGTAPDFEFNRAMAVLVRARSRNTDRMKSLFFTFIQLHCRKYPSVLLPI